MTTPETASVLAEIAAERAEQDAKWGQQNHPDRMPADYPVGDTPSAELAAVHWKNTNAARVAWMNERGVPRDRNAAWDGILLEEVYEALAEEDLAKLRAELVQVAAVAAAWIASIDRRTPTCTCTTDCPEDPAESSCPVCRERDPYDPCPVVGFGCGAGCDCCTPEQQRAADGALTPAAPSSTEDTPAAQCIGAANCSAALHVHGCYADQCADTGAGCDAPERTPRTWQSAADVPRYLEIPLSAADGTTYSRKFVTNELWDRLLPDGTSGGRHRLADLPADAWPLTEVLRTAPATTGGGPA
ncbi:MAG TPA: hypothetical protein VNO31_09445 [Umezawaea sp.]|nr:hypothetical protein [Umezawaea sp.]